MNVLASMPTAIVDWELSVDLLTSPILFAARAMNDVPLVPCDTQSRSLSSDRAAVVPKSTRQQGPMERATKDCRLRL